MEIISACVVLIFEKENQRSNPEVNEFATDAIRAVEMQL